MDPRRYPNPFCRPHRGYRHRPPLHQLENPWEPQFQPYSSPLRGPPPRCLLENVYTRSSGGWGPGYDADDWQVDVTQRVRTRPVPPCQQYFNVSDVPQWEPPPRRESPRDPRLLARARGPGWVEALRPRNLIFPPIAPHGAQFVPNPLYNGGQYMPQALLSPPPRRPVLVQNSETTFGDVLFLDLDLPTVQEAVQSHGGSTPLPIASIPLQTASIPSAVASIPFTTASIPVSVASIPLVVASIPLPPAGIPAPASIPVLASIPAPASIPVLASIPAPTSSPHCRQPLSTPPASSPRTVRTNSVKRKKAVSPSLLESDLPFSAITSPRQKAVSSSVLSSDLPSSAITSSRDKTGFPRVLQSDLRSSATTTRQKAVSRSVPQSDSRSSAIACQIIQSDLISSTASSSSPNTLQSDSVSGTASPAIAQNTPKAKASTVPDTVAPEARSTTPGKSPKRPTSLSLAPPPPAITLTASKKKVAPPPPAPPRITIHLKAAKKRFAAIPNVFQKYRSGKGRGESESAAIAGNSFSSTAAITQVSVSSSTPLPPPQANAGSDSHTDSNRCEVSKTIPQAPKITIASKEVTPPPPPPPLPPISDADTAPLPPISDPDATPPPISDRAIHAAPPNPENEPTIYDYHNTNIPTRVSGEIYPFKQSAEIARPIIYAEYFDPPLTPAPYTSDCEIIITEKTAELVDYAVSIIKCLRKKGFSSVHQASPDPSLREDLKSSRCLEYLESLKSPVVLILSPVDVDGDTVSFYLPKTYNLENAEGQMFEHLKPSSAYKVMRDRLIRVKYKEHDTLLDDLHMKSTLLRRLEEGQLFLSDRDYTCLLDFLKRTWAIQRCLMNRSKYFDTNIQSIGEVQRKILRVVNLPPPSATSSIVGVSIPHKKLVIDDAPASAASSQTTENCSSVIIAASENADEDTT